MLPMDDDTRHRVESTPLHYKRVLVRDGDGQPWHWFGPAIAFTIRTAILTDTAYAVLEDQLAEAVFRFPTQHIRVIEASTTAAFARMDLSG